MIIIFGTVFCALSTGGDIDGGGGGMAVMQYLAFWRFVLAFGIGSDYPISATVPSGQAAVTSRRRRGGQLITILTSIQGLGNMMASMVTLMVLIRFRAMIVDDDSDEENGAENMDMVWRICIAVGCLPALLTALIRHTIPAPGCRYRPEVDPQSRFDAAHHSDGMLDEDGVENNTSSSTFNSGLPPPAGAHSTSTLPPPTPLSSSKILRGRRAHATRVFREYCSQRKNLRVLIGTSLSWFFLDLAFRSIALNQSYLLDALETSSKSPQDNNNTTGSNKKTTIYHRLWITTLGNILISLLGIVPGYWFAIFSSEKMHHKRTQFLGFAALLFSLTLLSTAFHQLKAIVPLLITTFTVLQFFANLSKSTPFVVPGEVFPVRVRMTAHGVSAGSGKAGAVLVMVMFNRLVEVESPLGEHSFSSSGRSMTTVGVVLGMGMMMTVGALVVAFVFPRGTRRLLSSKRAWSRRSTTSSSGMDGTGSRVPHQSFEIDV
jgi:PHS family inorganic phosphate transporter-like MFS transporter